jgi:hypothetical protein
MILKRPPARRLSWPGWAAVLLLAVAVLPWRLGFTEPVPPLAAAEVSADEAVPGEPEKVRTPAPPADSGKIATREKALAVEDLRDEIELLEVQREFKAAGSEAAEMRLQGAEKLLQIQIQAKASAFEIEETKVQIRNLVADASCKKLELKEAEIKLRQAKRRLAALEAEPAVPAKPGPREADWLVKPRANQPEAVDRTKALIDKITAMEKELNALRKELERRPPPPRPDADRSSSALDELNKQLDELQKRREQFRSVLRDPEASAEVRLLQQQIDRLQERLAEVRKLEEIRERE